MQFVMSWRGVRGGRCLDRPALYLWRLCSNTVCAQSYKHTVCGLYYMFSDPLCPVGSGYGMDCSMAFASESCDPVCFCLVLDCTVIDRGGFNLVCLLSVSQFHG